MRLCSLTIILFILASPSAQAASFECIYAQPGVEETICTHEALGSLDETLGKYYQQLRTELAPAQAKALKASQKHWLVERDRICGTDNAQCLKDAYIKRINVLRSRYENTHPPVQDENYNQYYRKQCSIPDISFPDNLVVYSTGAYNGKKQTYQIDQSGSEAGEFEITVNSKDRPVALLLASYGPSVFKISRTQGTRIVAVVATGYNRVGVAGLPIDTPMMITYYKNGRGCPHPLLYHNDEPGLLAKVNSGAPVSVWEILRAHRPPPKDDNRGKLNELAQSVFGRPIDLLVKTDHWKAHLGAPLAQNEVLVRSSITPEDFKIESSQLAGPAGLQQALKAGLLRRATDSDRRRWIQLRARMTSKKPNEGIKDPFRRGDQPLIAPEASYVIIKPFNIPKGLYGGNLAVFYLEKGVPYPTGNLGHSLLYDFNTMQCHGGICTVPRRR